jgi:hypothetical protein
VLPPARICQSILGPFPAEIRPRFAPRANIALHQMAEVRMSPNSSRDDIRVDHVEVRAGKSLHRVRKALLARSWSHGCPIADVDVALKNSTKRRPCLDAVPITFCF